MLTFLFTVALAGLLMGIAANQVTRILCLGSLFEPLRMELSFQASVMENRVARFLNTIFECHLCLGTHVAAALTTAGAVTAAFSGAGAPVAAWAFGLVLTAFVAGGVDQMIEMVRGSAAS